MSLHISIVSIEGDAQASLEQLFIDCDYKLNSPPVSVDTWDNLYKLLLEPEDKGTVYHKSRTTIIDPELVMMLDEEPMKKLSKQFGSVLTMVCEGVSATYGFAVYREGEKIRSLTVVDGSVADEFGHPLPEEDGISASDLSEDTVLDILTKLGFDYTGLEQARGFNVYKLEFAEDVQSESDKSLNKLTVIPRKKPWWQFW